MPGLFGVFLKERRLTREALERLAGRMAESMRHTPWLRTEIWGNDTFCGGRVHLGVSNPEPQPLHASEKRVSVWIDGECFPRTPAPPTTPLAERVWQLVNDTGAPLADVDGVFNLACLDGGGSELVLANDRLGFRPLYYTETADWFAYAGEVKALLAIRDTLPDLDEISVRQFFGFDHMLGERTWWKGIELLPPASVWHISSRGRATRQYWTFEAIRAEPRQVPDALAELGRLWSADVARHRKPDTMPLLLSGGLDSRLLLAELRAQGASVRPVTFGSDESPEMQPARRVAAIAGLRHHAVRMTPHTWWNDREEAVWQTDGLVNGNHLHPAIAKAEMRTGSCHSLMNIAGDLLFGGSHLFRNELPVWRQSPDHLLANRYMKNPFFGRDEVLSVSAADGRRYLHGPSSDCFHLRQRYRRYVIHSPGCLASYCEFGFPGLSRALLDFSLGSLPESERLDSAFYNRFLVATHPRYFRDVPWQRTGRGLAESRPTRLRRSAEGRLRRLLRRQRPPVASNQWFVDFPECVRRSRVRETLLSTDLIADQVLEGAAKRALANHDSAPLAAEEVIAILTFETYLRRAAGHPRLAIVSPA